MNDITILALDISSTHIGVCYNGEPRDTVKLKGADIAGRCWQAEEWIHEQMHVLGDIDLIVFEEPVGKFVKSIMPQCHVQGAILADIYETGITWTKIAPSVAKKILTGKGNADKAAMIAAAQLATGKLLDEHQADAYALWLAARALKVEKVAA